MDSSLSIVANQQELAAGIGWVARSLPQRPSTPVLLGVLLTASGQTLTAAGTDHDVSCRTAVPAQVGAEGTCVVPGRMLAEILRLLPPGPVELEAEGDRLLVRRAGASYSLPVLPIADYPVDHVVLPGDGGVTLDAGVFLAAVGQVAIAAARDEVVPALAGIHLTFGEEYVELAATDRYRLGVCRVPLAEPVEPFTLLVPARSLAELTRTFAADGVPLRLVATGSTVALHNGTRSARLGC